MRILFSVLLLGLFLAGCGKPEKSTADIDVEAAQDHYDNWLSQRIDQIEANPNLTDSQKAKQIEEVKASAAGQMKQVQGLAEGQGDDRKRGQ